jgi:hypothetical protein
VAPIIWGPMTHRGSQPFFRCSGNGGIWAPEPDLDLQAEYLADNPRELAPGCGKPQVKLYLSPDGERLACRDCGRVSYASSQDVRPRPWWNGCLVRAAQSGPARVTKGFLLSLMQAVLIRLAGCRPSPRENRIIGGPLGGQNGSVDAPSLRRCSSCRSSHSSSSWRSQTPRAAQAKSGS